MTSSTAAQEYLRSFPPGTTRYEMLGVAVDATDHDLKVAYRRQALLYHPDRHPPEDRPAAEQLFKDITAAYRILSNAKQRQQYDRALRAGHDYREGEHSDAVVSLETILADIGEYECIFSPEQLGTLDSALAEVVTENLIDELGEQIVEVYRLQQPPIDATFKGQFKSGAVVLTNIRVLVPFIYSWEETSGNVKTVYRGMSVPNVTWPLVTKLHVVEKRRLTDDVVVRLEQEQGTVAFRAVRNNLAELLLIANLWGVPCELSREDARRAEWWSAASRPFKVLGGLSLLVLFAGGVLGWLTDEGFFEGVTILATWAARSRLTQAMVLFASFWATRGVARWMHVYRSSNLLDVMQEQATRVGPPTGSSGTMVTAA
jgi:hypothetical protein